MRKNEETHRPWPGERTGSGFDAVMFGRRRGWLPKRIELAAHSTWKRWAEVGKGHQTLLAVKANYSSSESISNSDCSLFESETNDSASESADCLLWQWKFDVAFHFSRFQLTVFPSIRRELHIHIDHEAIMRALLTVCVRVLSKIRPGNYTPRRH